MINTVSKSVTTTDFGNVLIHEHIGCISNDLTHIFKDKWLNKQELTDFAAEILIKIRDKYGVGLFVDGTPIDLGRDISLLKSVSEKANIPIVAATGLYHYPAFYTSAYSESEMAAWFIKECEEGIEETDIKPGILKAATDRIITTDNKKRLAAMAIVQNETHLPIYIHSTHNDDIIDRQIEILLRYITHTEKIIIGHTALNPQKEYLERILDMGCYICVDQCHCTRYDIDTIGKMLVSLCKKGYTDKILLSNDLCIYSDFETSKSNGLQLSASQQAEKFGHIFTVVHESFMENGGSENDWGKMFKINSLKALDV